jgi:hypothetical protein
VAFRSTPYKAGREKLANAEKAMNVANRPDRYRRLAGYLYLEVRCFGCDTNQTVALDIVRRPKTTAIDELERYMRCKVCSQVRGYPYKRSHLVALRHTKISASNPPSYWWPGER